MDFSKKRAQNVCQACMVRKKGCDKALPACGYCASRQLLCRYDASMVKSQGRRKYNPGRHFVALRSPSPTSTPCRNDDSTEKLQASQSQDNFTPTNSSSSCNSQQSVEESLHRLVHHFIGLTNLTLDNIIDNYFHIFHEWLPVISPTRFRREESSHRVNGGFLPSDLSVLLLAMLMSILPDLNHSSRPSRESQEILYTTTKSAFSQAQSSICASLRLLQASLLITIREYTSLRLEAAYISMMTCVGLTRIVGIGPSSGKSARYTQAHKESEFELEEKEKLRLSWTVSLLERLILCELGRDDLQPQTMAPNPECWLASEMDRVDYDKRAKDQALNHNTFPGLHPVKIGQLEWQAHSVSMLDQLLVVISLEKEEKLARLTEMDVGIRNLLEMVGSELEWRKTLTCAHVALCIRMLFILYGSIIDTVKDTESEVDRQRIETSWLGMDAICRMIVDVARVHGEVNTRIMPICSFYNLQLARERMEERSKIQINESYSHDIESLVRSQELYRKTWVF